MTTASLPVEEELEEDISGEEEGAEQERDEEDGEAEFLPHVDRYIQQLHENHRSGFCYDPQRLKKFHSAVRLTPKNLSYYAKPRPRDCIERVDETPSSDHPLRAIAAVLESAPVPLFESLLTH